MGSCDRKPAQQIFVMCHLSREVPAACPGVAISTRSVGNASNYGLYIRCACNTPIYFSIKIKTVASKKLNCSMETSTALLLPRTAGTDFPNQGLRSSSVSKQYGLLGTRGHSWPEAPPQEHLQNPCSDLAAPI